MLFFGIIIILWKVLLFPLCCGIINEEITKGGKALYEIYQNIFDFISGIS